jgi:hypothetical protein
MRYAAAAALAVLFVAPPVVAAGFVHNANFTVLTPPEPNQEAGQRFARQVLDRAERYRAEIAKEWLGEELPPGIGRTMINVRFSESNESGSTWAKDHPERTLHGIFLTTSRNRVLGGMLRHEITHAILATRYPHPNRLPPWIEEGIASTYDDDDRLAICERMVRWWATTGNMPPLDRVIEAGGISADDQTAYAAAGSLTAFLLQRRDKETLLTFGKAGLQDGWNAALEEHYDIQNVDALQSAWEAWVRKQ